MSIPDPRVSRFADSLDELLDSENELPEDDRCNYAEVIGCLFSRCFFMILDARERQRELGDDEYE